MSKAISDAIASSSGSETVLKIRARRNIKAQGIVGSTSKLFNHT